MVYTKTSWLEHSMNTAAKNAALVNLESMYDTAVDYVQNTVTHSSSYFTEDYCIDNFFDEDTDGDGSTLMVDKLDGLTAEEIIAIGIPKGAIAIWTKDIDDIPAGWYLCDGGTYGTPPNDVTTPDLRNKFLISAGGTYSVGDTGGAATPSITGTVTIAGTVLDATMVPSHTHTYADHYLVADNIASSGYGYQPTTQQTGKTTTVAAGSAHGHTGSTFDGDSLSILPKYYVVSYIMRW